MHVWSCCMNGLYWRMEALRGKGGGGDNIWSGSRALLVLRLKDHLNNIDCPVQWCHIVGFNVHLGGVQESVASHAIIRCEICIHRHPHARASHHIALRVPGGWLVNVPCREQGKESQTCWIITHSRLLLRRQTALCWNYHHHYQPHYLNGASLPLIHRPLTGCDIIRQNGHDYMQYVQLWFWSSFMWL